MSDSSVDVLIVGAGVMGCAAAYQLARDGARVLLLDQFEVGHDRGSSHGPSRIIRLAYDSLDYVALARASFALWRELEAESGEHLLSEAGGLDVGSPGALALDEIRATYVAAGVPFEQLDRDAIVGRFPQFNLPEDTVGLYQADYSLLAAGRCVATLAAQARQHGAIIHEREQVRQLRAGASSVQVRTDQGVYMADRLILSAGSWMRPLLRQLDLALPLTVLKEQLAFFRARDPREFMPGRLPLVIHRFPKTTSLGSVFPIFDHAGVKVMIDRVGPQVAPDDPDRSIDAPLLHRLHAYATDLLPGLTGEIIEAVSCRYTMTPDEHFIIDRHPAHPHIVIASPCSGHGFKFGAVIGRILADLALHGATSYDIGRFRLDRPALKQL
ncbi:MAG TPA: N-methyl-L-tryptophan oxidase [Roseiflexaceae bacterium]|nr:N-methyl-L-tryptophan oxidase [Roseiflexaceae bacterium]